MNQPLHVLGIDIAKEVFPLVGMDVRGHVVWRRRLYLMPPPCVTPEVQANNNDRRDAEAMAEAVTRPARRFAPIKAVAQQDVPARLRGRARLMKARTALINETRGLWHEYGIVMPKGALTFRQQLLSTWAANDAKLTPMSQALFQQHEEELAAIEDHLTRYDAQLTRRARSQPVCQRLMTIPGLGELTATALVAAVSDAAQFKHGRQFAAWWGLVPQQHSTGGKPRLLGSSTCGDAYLRPLLVHGARSGLRGVERQRDRRSQWARSLLERRAWNRAAVALAHKNAGVAWVLLRTDQVSCATAV